MKSFLLVSSLVISVNVFAAIPKFQAKDFRSLIKTAQSSSLPMSQRWEALVKAGQIAKPEELSEIRKFAKNSEWFMRNASLVALDGKDSAEAEAQARMLVKDKALVVRSAAVGVLIKNNSQDVRRLLADELAKPYNYSGKQSLWIRPQIMKHLAKRATALDRQFMARYLFDSDKKVATLSANALEKMSAVTYTGPKRLEQWQTHVKKNGWF